MNHLQPINIMKKFEKIDKIWTPHIIAELNNQYVKLCKLKGDFVWHLHENEDELFMVFKGTLFIDIKNGDTLEINEGELVVIPKGVEHRPRTNGGIVFNLLFEPKETLHTGAKQTAMTVNESFFI